VALNTVIEAMLAISSEIELPRLLATLMRVVIENAGAQRAAFAQEQAGAWGIVAAGDRERCTITLARPPGIETREEFRAGVICHVARTRQRVILDSAVGYGMFSDDPFIRQHAAASILCTPLLREGRLVGILYLESNLSTPAFTPDRVQLLEIMLAQGAISLENARVYQALQASEKKCRTLYESMMDAYASVDMAGRFNDCNSAFYNLVGYTADEVRSLTYTDITPENWHEQDVKVMQEQLLTRGYSDIYEKEFRRKDGMRIPIELRISLIRDEAGRPVAMWGIIRDITERKRAEHDLNRIQTILSESQKIAHLGSFEYLAESRETIWSEEEFRIYGLTPGAQSPVYEDMLKHHIHPDDAALLDKVFKDALRDGRIYELEHRIVRPDGSERVVYDLAYPYFDEQGNLLRYIGTTLDITEKVRILTALKAEREFLRKVINTAPGMIFLKDSQGRYILANKALGDAYGTTIEGVVGKTDGELIPDAAEAARFRQDDAEVIRTRRENVVAEEPLTTADGRTRWFTTIKVPLVNDDGTCDKMLGVAIDITERKQIREELVRLNASLEQRVAQRTVQLEMANNELEAFSYSVSHDLRAPLRHITGFINLLRQRAADGLDDKNRHYLTVIARAAEQMGTLIDDVLAFSRMGRAEMATTLVDTRQMVEELIASFRQESKGRDISWSVAPLPRVRGDPSMLRAVWVNLISNAVKFTAGKAPAVIRIGHFGQAGEDVFFVKDNGAGFDMRYVDKLFGLFQRLHRAEDFEGTGVGLANVRRIVSRHGGRTWAEGAPGQGASFYFSLPKVKDE
jgi:PAS domain S-box-containing protein